LATFSRLENIFGHFGHKQLVKNTSFRAVNHYWLTYNNTNFKHLKPKRKPKYVIIVLLANKRQ